MNYEQLIEELREEMLQLVNTKCDALLQMYRSGRTAYKCERYDPGKLPYHSIPGRTEREKTAGSPVRAGRMDRDAYGVRSDDSHGDTLKYLKEKDGESLVNLSSILDDYVRRVFKKLLLQKN